MFRPPMYMHMHMHAHIHVHTHALEVESYLSSNGMKYDCIQIHISVLEQPEFLLYIKNKHIKYIQIPFNLMLNKNLL